MGVLKRRANASTNVSCSTPKALQAGSWSPKNWISHLAVQPGVSPNVAARLRSANNMSRFGFQSFGSPSPKQRYFSKRSKERGLYQTAGSRWNVIVIAVLIGTAFFLSGTLGSSFKRRTQIESHHEVTERYVMFWEDGRLPLISKPSKLNHIIHVSYCFDFPYYRFPFSHLQKVRTNSATSGARTYRRPHSTHEEHRRHNC